MIYHQNNHIHLPVRTIKGDKWYKTHAPYLSTGSDLKQHKNQDVTTFPKRHQGPSQVIVKLIQLPSCPNNFLHIQQNPCILKHILNSLFIQVLYSFPKGYKY